MKTITTPVTKQNLAEEHVAQPRWQRIALLSVLGYEAAGCLLGGSFLIVEPDGSLMNMPVEIMHGTFRDFLIPGIILFGLGILNTFAFIAVFKRKAADWLMASFGLGGLLIWFWVEIAVLLQLHWLHAMWGLPVVLGSLMIFSLLPERKIMIHRAMLVCGILASLLYACINVIVAMQWPGYSSVTQTVSELSAVNSPTRALWNILCAPYTLFMIIFSYGVYRSSSQNRPLRIASVLLVAYSTLGIIWPFAPMHLRETLASGGDTISDTVHLALGAITEIIYLVALGFAGSALGNKFRNYCIATFLILLIFGVLTFRDAPDVSKNLPTPFIGVWERINIGVFLLWVVVLAVRLLDKKRRLCIIPELS